MKTALTKHHIFLTIFLLLGCSKHFDKEKNSTSNGFYVQYPFIERKTVFIKNEIMKFEMDKIITKKSINYNLGFENKELYPIPFNRDILDYEPTFDSTLNSLLDKTPDSSIVIKYQYGTSDIEWNYLYIIKNKKIFLETLFFIESYGQKSDTIAYISKINIDRPIAALNMKEIRKKMTNAENRKTKDFKYILR